ncbi:MAG: DUF4139 domain-containing protein [Rhodocyclaceae bacterium]|nr:DUF4139 domain-containing protein [Rhodocyclaceae bacterium]
MIGLGAVMAAGCALAAEAAHEVVSTAAEREAIALTVYNDDLALIKERRRVSLPAGLARLSLREVAAQMRPETALLRAASGRPITLVEQNFDFDLLTPATLLEKYVGREVTVLRAQPTSGEERAEKAIVLAATNGIVLRFADRIETGVPGRIAFPSVPANLRDRPTLSVLLEGAGGAQSLELSYITGGLSWQADYVVNLAADGRHMDLSGWVTLTNRSGAAYDDAALQLVAGTVNRVRPPGPTAYAMRAPASALARKADVAQESLMDYHLYSFAHPTSIAANQTKQLALLSAAAIPVQREYVLAGSEYYYRERYGQIGQKLKPAVFVAFDNQGGSLGKPLPAGVVRVYAKDSKGAAQFVGEDRIEHTAKNETVKLKLGEAFDITAERRQLAYKKLGDTTAESAFRIDLRNAGDEAVTVRVQEPLPGDWEIVRETLKSTKESARVAAWNVEVPAGGAAALEYAVRVRW